MSETKLSEATIKKINDELGSSTINIELCESLKKRLEDERNELGISFSVTNSAVPSKLSLVIKDTEACCETIRELVQRYEKLKSAVDKYNKKVGLVKVKSEEYIEKIKILENTSQYLNLIKEIENISNAIESGINDKNERKQVINFIVLCDIHNMIKTYKCQHLQSFIYETLFYWHNILRERFTADYDEVLKAIKWPFVSNSVLGVPSTEVLNQFQMLTEHLLQIQLDKEGERGMGSSSLPTTFSPLSLPMSLLIKPLRKRFMYHFMGARQTNRADKPEWFFTQILTWVKDHQDFIDKNLQPVYEKVKRRRVPAKVELMNGLVELAVEKLHQELIQLQYDDDLFSHAVDEALGFDKEMKDLYGYPDSQPGVLEVLTQARVFEKWINMEKKFSCEKMDRIMSSETVWDSLMSRDVDEYHVTECADSFMILLSTITERYQALPQPGHRLRFLDLQLYLINDWRIRMIQITREDIAEPLNSKLTSVANTISYVRDVLEEWGANTHFLQLLYYKNKLEHVEEDSPTELIERSVFEENIELLTRTKDELVYRVADHVLMEVKAKSMPYRRDKWHVMESPKDLSKPIISQSACTMFQVLTNRLHHLQSVFAAKLFRQAWLRLAAGLDQFLYEEIPALCYFNEGGALQFHYDITRNLFPLFAQYSNKPEAHFKLLRDSCIVLCMTKGSAYLLKQTLTDENKETCDGTEILGDVSIFTLNKQQVLSILNRRTDLL